MELSYKTKIDVEIDYDSVKPAGFDYESRDSSTDVSYKVAIDSRDWGIKSISFYGIPQEIVCNLLLQETNSEEVDSHMVKIQIVEISTEGPEEIINRDLCGETLNISITEISKSDDGFIAKATAVLYF